MFRTRNEVFNAYDGKKIGEDQLSRFFEVAENGNRDVRAMSLFFLLNKLGRFKSVANFSLDRFSKESDYNLRVIILNGFAIWFKNSILIKKAKLVPEKRQLSQIFNIVTKQLQSQNQLDLNIASVVLLESMLHFVISQNQKQDVVFASLSSEIANRCSYVLANETSYGRVFVYALQCVKLARKNGISVGVPTYESALKNYFVNLYLDSKIFLK